MLTVVTGPPAGGKSTYVREHSKPGDIIVDFDASAARNAGVPVWLIHAQPTRADLQRYRTWRARILTIDPGETIVRQRAADERAPLTTRYIDQWYTRAPA